MIPTTILYFLYNYYIFISDFFNKFPLKKEKIKYPELYQKPYNLFFVKFFGNKIIKILRIIDLKNKITLDYKLKYNFYKDLEKIPLFKKTVEIVIKT